MKIILKISSIQVQEKEYPFETTFDITDLNHVLQTELKNELLANLLGVTFNKDEVDDDDEADVYSTPKRGPGRPRKT